MNDDRYLHERNLLGLLLQHPEKFIDVADEIKASYLYDEINRRIYEMMLDQFGSNGKISRTKLFIDLKRSGIVSGADELISDFEARFISVDDLALLIDQVKTLHLKRQLYIAGERIQQMATDEDMSLSEAQAKAQDSIFNATEFAGKSSKHIYDANSALSASYSAYIERKQGTISRGVSSGFMSLDRLTGGFKNGHLVILSASTSMGKTSFALNVAKNILLRNEPVAIISLEMDATEIMDRMIVSEAQVHARKYADGQLNAEEEQKVSRALDKLQHVPLLISDERGLNASQIRARLRKFKTQMGKLSLVIIDYLQLISLSDTDKKDNTARQVGTVCTNLRNLAGDLDCPIILLSQISRSFNTRQDKRPILSDLRDSGNIEEVADGVIFLYRHAHTSVAAREQCREECTENHAEVIAAKNRTGGTGTVKMLFEDYMTLFRDFEELSYGGV